MLDAALDLHIQCEVDERDEHAVQCIRWRARAYKNLSNNRSHLTCSRRHRRHSQPLLQRKRPFERISSDDRAPGCPLNHHGGVEGGRAVGLEDGGGEQDVGAVWGFTAGDGARLEVRLVWGGGGGWVCVKVGWVRVKRMVVRDDTLSSSPAPKQNRPIKLPQPRTSGDAP